jgi:two-component system OmpR family sensor kinase
MDGLQVKLYDSLQLRLSLWLAVAIIVMALIAGVFAFFSAFDEAHELQDDVLRQVAALFNGHNLPEPHQGDEGRLADNDEESRVIVQYVPTKLPVGARTESKTALTIPETIPDGIQTRQIGDEPFRVLVKTLDTGVRIAVAQETGLRNEIARDSALRTLLPFLILVPILLLLVANLVRTMFKPIAALSADIDQRNEQELHALAPDSLPSEVRPFVVAINRLLNRVSQAMDTQRRFIADAAHELRTPLTALSLQAERLDEVKISSSARDRLTTLRRGVERLRGLVDQLLALARAQSAAVVTAKQPVSVHLVYRRVLEDLMPLAEAKNIDIGVVEQKDFPILANELDLVTIVRNLVVNAINYTPKGGRVDLSVHYSINKIILQIDDSGPGITPKERDQVFDPFHRVLGNNEVGSGLGLSIVRTIASRLDADVSLGYANEQTHAGLSVKVMFPVTPIEAPRNS